MALLALDDRAGRWQEMLLEKLTAGEVVMLDRASADALINEREILLADTKPGEVRSLLRKWVSADLLISLEAFAVEEGEPERARVRVLDGKTGIRLLDRTHRISASSLERDLSEMADWIQGPGVEAWRGLWMEDRPFRAVTVLDVNLASVPPEPKKELEELSFLLEQRLIQDPDLLLLERELLEILLEERELNPAMRGKLEGAVLLLRVSFHPTPAGISYRIEGMSSDGGERFRREKEDVFGGDRLSPAAMVSMVLEAAREDFRLPGGPRKGDFEAEAWRHADMAGYYLAWNQVEKARQYARTALWMRPSSEEIHQQYQKILYASVAQRIRGSASDEQVLTELRHLIEITAPLGETSSSLQNLFTDVQRMQRRPPWNPEVEAEWRAVQSAYRRTHEFVKRQRRGLGKSYEYEKITPEERNNHFRVKILSGVPLTMNDIKFLWGKWACCGETSFGPLPVEIALALVDQTLRDPDMPELEKITWLSMLYFTLRDEDTQFEAKFQWQIDQWILRGIREPKSLSAFPSSGYMDPDYQRRVLEAMVAARERIESEGWLIPELYRKDGREGIETFARKLKDPSLRLVPWASGVSFKGDVREEVLKRRAYYGKLKETLYQKTGGIVGFEIPYARGRSIRATGVFGEHLVVRAQSDSAGGQALHFYQAEASGKPRLLMDIPLRPPESGERRSREENRHFRERIFAGAKKLYVPFHHRLLVIGEDLTVEHTLVLADVGFPGYVVTNVLETDRGGLVGVTHRTYGFEGGLGAARRGASALLLINGEGEIERILSHTDRSPAENKLDKAAPHDFAHMDLLPNGRVLIHPTRFSSDRYELDLENMRVDLVETPPTPSFELARTLEPPEAVAGKMELYRNFLNTYGNDFQLPVSPVTHSSQSAIIRIGQTVYAAARRIHNRSSKSEITLYAFPIHGNVDSAWAVELDNDSHPRSLKRWGDHLVFTGPYRVRILDPAELRASNGKPYAHLRRFDPGDLEAWRADYMDRIQDNPVPEPEITETPDPTLDGLIPVPGGEYTPLTDEGVPTGRTVSIQPFRLGRTEVTLEEWARVVRWAKQRGYRFIKPASAMAETFPLRGVHPFDAFLYCNARSEMEGLRPAYYLDEDRKQVFRDGTEAPKPQTFRGFEWAPNMIDLKAGYRLPTEEEWEFAARGADPDHRARYPWGDRISHEKANYRATPFYPFDESAGGISWEVAQTELSPYLPADSLPGHGYENKFHNLIGNAAEIVMAGFPASSEDPAGESISIRNVTKGGAWFTDAEACSIPKHETWTPYGTGFRILLPAAPAPQPEPPSPWPASREGSRFRRKHPHLKRIIHALSPPPVAYESCFVPDP